MSDAIKSAGQSLINGSTGKNTDVPALVAAIVNARVAGFNAANAAKQKTSTSQLTAVGSLKSVMSLLQSALATLSDGTALSAVTAKADGKGITATAGKGTTAGSYAIQVTNIAASQSITSGGFGAKEALGTGTLKLSVGASDVSIKIDSSNNTLSGIAAAINSASGNPGVSATVITGTDGAHLVLHSSTTGVANGISVEVTPASEGDNTGLSKLNVSSSTSTVDPSDPDKTVAPYTTIGTSANWKQTAAGKDALLTVAGTEVSSPGNSVTSAIAGLSINLTSESVGTTQTLSISSDTSAQQTSIKAFVTAYNNFIGMAASLTSFDKSQPKGSQGGPLLGDSMMNTVRNALATAISKGVPSAADGTKGMVNLGSIGITLQKDNTLKIDETALSAALANKPGTVNTLFNSKSGLGAEMNKTLTTFLKKDGLLDTRTTSLNKDLDNIKVQGTKLDAFATQLTNSYNAQFTALNTLMAHMSSNASYLTALFGGANSAGALAGNKG
ncbi:flagellar filament capping protein FliD [Caballeronia sordidicola]|uniref:flagellar filament capping protein FliD n=1 Tax=Caballeronia sordidicola TaxID=196367 RepID=UPI00068EF233|nr:flagellar filament capping protein FliD [Caballeronia sordidicola]